MKHKYILDEEATYQKIQEICIANKIPEDAITAYLSKRNRNDSSGTVKRKSMTTENIFRISRILGTSVDELVVFKEL